MTVRTVTGPSPYHPGAANRAAFGDLLEDRIAWVRDAGEVRSTRPIEKLLRRSCLGMQLSLVRAIHNVYRWERISTTWLPMKNHEPIDSIYFLDQFEGSLKEAASYSSTRSPRDSLLNACHSLYTVIRGFAGDEKTAEKRRKDPSIKAVVRYMAWVIENDVLTNPVLGEETVKAMEEGIAEVRSSFGLS